MELLKYWFLLVPSYTKIDVLKVEVSVKVKNYTNNKVT